MGCAVNGLEKPTIRRGITFGRGVECLQRRVPMSKVSGEHIVEAFVMETEKLGGQAASSQLARTRPIT